MKNTIFKLIAVLMIISFTVLAVSCYSVKPDDAETYEITDDKAVGSFQIKLVENPTTGYQWQWTTTGDGELNCIADTYLPDDASEQRPGSGGTRVFSFSGAKTGEGKLNLVYKRSWEETSFDTELTVGYKVVDNGKIIITSRPDDSRIISILGLNLGFGLTLTISD